MARSLWLLPVLCGLAGSAQADEISTVVASPYKLAKYVETHANFDWAPIWKALDLSERDVFLPRCEESHEGVAPCSSELIAVMDPPQVIVLLEERTSWFEVFLRYQDVGAGVWRFSGAFSPFVKYFHPEHRLTRFGTKPFLIVTGQGWAGTGASSKIESWIDLTKDGLKPALAFTSEGDCEACAGVVGKSIRGSVVSLTTQPVERITVSFDVEFDAVREIGENIRIGGRRDHVVYSRTGRGNFEMDQSLSTATAKEVERFYENAWAPDNKAEFLKFNLKGLIGVATGEDSKARLWLSRYLRTAPDTPESRQLKALLAPTR